MFIAIPILLSEEIPLIFILKDLPKSTPAMHLQQLYILYFCMNYTLKQILRVLVTNPFLVQGFFPNIFAIGMNGGTWSLTVEMFLYFLFPFLILLSAKSPKILIASLLIAAITSFNVYADKSEYIYANPVFRLADFINSSSNIYTLWDANKSLFFSCTLLLT
jgi:peptidoglycan/LPS O-acetylase OafA/YrhL